MLPEVSRGHSSRPPWLSKARRERASTCGVVSRTASLGSEPPYGGQSVAAVTVIQWLESSRQRDDLKLVLNRRMRTRMYGGVGGVPGNRAPIPIAWLYGLWVFDEVFGYHGRSSEMRLLVFPESSVVPVPYCAHLCCGSSSARKSLVVRSMEAPTFPSDSTQSWLPVLLYFRTTCSKPPWTRSTQ